MSAVAQNLQTPTAMPDPIVFSDSAAAKVAELIAEEGNPELKLRVFVQAVVARASSTASRLTKSPTRTTRR